MIRRSNIVQACLFSFVVFTVASRTPTAEGGCPGSGDCCAIHGGTGGCDDFNCCDEVCSAEPFCCFAGWDADCVGLAEVLCGSLCSASACPATGDCCQAHASPGCSNASCCDLVCTANAACCSSVWSMTCATLATQICDVCAPPIVCPMAGECCTRHEPTPGCNREACCDLVCNVLGDGFCCRIEWDDVCARKANENCPNVCVCAMFADLDDNGIVNLRDFAMLQTCFTGNVGMVGDECACADYDGNDRVGLADFAVFFDVFTAP